MNRIRFGKTAKQSVAAGAVVAGLSLAFVAGTFALPSSTAFAATSKPVTAVVSSAPAAPTANTAASNSAAGKTTSTPAAQTGSAATSGKAAPAAASTTPAKASSAEGGTSSSTSTGKAASGDAGSAGKAASTQKTPATTGQSGSASSQPASGTASSGTAAGSGTAASGTSTSTGSAAAGSGSASSPKASETQTPAASTETAAPLSLTQTIDNTIASVPTAPISDAITAKIAELEKANNFDGGFLYIVDPAYASDFQLTKSDKTVDHFYVASGVGVVGNPTFLPGKYVVNNAKVGGAWFYATGNNKGQLIQYNSNGEPETSYDNSGLTVLVLRAVPRDTKLNYNFRLAFKKADFQKGETLTSGRMTVWQSNKKIQLPEFNFENDLDPTLKDKFTHEYIVHQAPKLPLFNPATGQQYFYSMDNYLWTTGNVKDSDGNPIYDFWIVGVGFASKSHVNDFSVAGAPDRFVNGSIRFKYLRTNGEPDVSPRPSQLNFTLKVTPSPLTSHKAVTAPISTNDTDGAFPHIIFYGNDLRYKTSDGSDPYTLIGELTPTKWVSDADKGAYSNNTEPYSHEDTPARHNSFSLEATAPEGYTVKSVKGDGWHGWDVSYVKNFVGTETSLSYKDASGKDVKKTITLEKDEPLGDALKSVEVPATLDDGGKLAGWVDAKTNKPVDAKTIVTEGLQIKAVYTKLGAPLSFVGVHAKGNLDATGKRPIDKFVTVEAGQPLGADALAQLGLPNVLEHKPGVVFGGWLDQYGHPVNANTVIVRETFLDPVLGIAGTPLVQDSAKVSYTDTEGNKVTTDVPVEPGTSLSDTLNGVKVKPATDGEKGAWFDGKGKLVTDKTTLNPSETYSYVYHKLGDPLIQESATKPAAKKAAQKAAVKAMPKKAKKGTPETGDASAVVPALSAATGLLSTVGALVLRKKRR